MAVVLLAVSWGGASASTRYTIFGQVLDESGLGLAGVTLFIEGDTEAVVTTDENGVWTAEVRGTVTVTPEKVDFAFSPRQYTFTPETQPGVLMRAITGKIVGRVVIRGEVPDRPITVWVLRSPSSDEESQVVQTDEAGLFVIPLEGYSDLEALIVSVDSNENYTDEEIEELGLTSWSHIYGVPAEPRFLPDLDLYAYGFGLLKPEDEEVVTSLPYEVQISPYDRDVEPFYEMYFWGAENSWLGSSSELFYEESFTFDGSLDTGAVLSEDAEWYVSVNFEQDELLFSLDAFGNLVYFGSAPEED